MKSSVPVGKYNYEVRQSSAHFLAKVDAATLQTPNLLPQRISIIDLPFCKLAVGYSFWFDMDNMPDEMKQAIMRAMRYYNKRFDCFDWKKHRGDGRISGFKFLEIARIK